MKWRRVGVNIGSISSLLNKRWMSQKYDWGVGRNSSTQIRKDEWPRPLVIFLVSNCHKNQVDCRLLKQNKRRIKLQVQCPNFKHTPQDIVKGHKKRQGGSVENAWKRSLAWIINIYIPSFEEVIVMFNPNNKILKRSRGVLQKKGSLLASFYLLNQNSNLAHCFKVLV